MHQSVCLITCDDLPFSAAATGGGELHRLFATLSSQGTLFENHYLQAQGFGSILDGLSDAQCCLADDRVQLVMCRVPGQKQSLTPEVYESLPGQWVKSDISRAIGPAEHCDRLFRWFHLRAGVSAFDGDLVAEVLDLVQRLLLSGCCVVVTAVRGSDGLNFPFESLLPEHRVRVPLWVLSGQSDCGRIQTVTGSFDLTRVIGEFLDYPLVPRVESDSIHPGAMVDPGTKRSRRVLIRYENVHAVRTDNFLFVQQQEPASRDGILSSALYAKPEDVWNVSDVSVQYPEAVSEFQRCF
ncbi:MAG: hypothetical protein R3C49_11810 [Planctomycetaceae bacterium]